MTRANESARRAAKAGRRIWDPSEIVSALDAERNDATEEVVVWMREHLSGITAPNERDFEDMRDWLAARRNLVRRSARRKTTMGLSKVVVLVAFADDGSREPTGVRISGPDGLWAQWGDMSPVERHAFRAPKRAKKRRKGTR